MNSMSKVAGIKNSYLTYHTLYNITYSNYFEAYNRHFLVKYAQNIYNAWSYLIIYSFQTW